MAANQNHRNRELDSYTINGTGLVINPGDSVLLRADESSQSKLPYVALIEKLEAVSVNNVIATVRWYYRPEEIEGGKRQFHGSNELFLSDHRDTLSVHTIERKFTVHPFDRYTRLDTVDTDDYFYRCEYKVATGEFIPNDIPLYCKCEMPYNPDDLMVECEGCNDWFHPSCVLMSNEDATRLDKFFCTDCSSGHDRRLSMKSFLPSTSSANPNLKSKRRKR